MTITLRRRKRKDGIESLILDYYFPKANRKRIREKLDLFVYSNPKTVKERSHNKKTLLLAENIRSKKFLEIQHEEHGFSHLIKDNLDKNFITYFSEKTEKRYNESSFGNYSNWDGTLKHLIKFRGDYVPFREVDSKWLEDFKYYLKHTAKTKSSRPLSQNSCYSYFNKVRACIKEAIREGIISYNPAEQVKGFKQGESEREFLTLEELKKVANTECEIPILKQAFLFSALTGLRWSDVHKLVWKEVQYSEEQGHYIRFKQKKTNGYQTHPIPEQAFKLLADRGEDEERVFKGLRYSAWNNLKLQQWVMKAGISKTITFHCARHTYATLQLTFGTDIYTVSKLLGHKELKTTQVYAKIINQKKVDAANAIPDINW
ncbi:tyrosine-type recombinase/integrase [Winogradskyella luteola]|uniref:Site-specific integrase n=1 Tax=Winogradskyella luteola TaxID=2828330 RepID=A0A9X1FCI3_9FLAO|nr:site-specific integrase [Winogradskyella luteola]MBV7270568.1 site-specific integrase [Winogradskyella luteola]